MIENGEVLRDNLKQELMSENELLSQLRQKGVDDVSCVKDSFIEGDGHFSVITDQRSTPMQATAKKSAL